MTSIFDQQQYPDDDATATAGGLSGGPEVKICQGDGPLDDPSDEAWVNWQPGRGKGAGKYFERKPTVSFFKNVPPHKGIDGKKYHKKWLDQLTAFFWEAELYDSIERDRVRKALAVFTNLDAWTKKAIGVDEVPTKDLIAGKVTVDSLVLKLHNRFVEQIERHADRRKAEMEF